MATATKSQRSTNLVRPAVTFVYNAIADDKKRISLPKTSVKHFQVSCFSNGDLLLKPMVLVPQQAISRRTIRMLDKAAANFKKGRVSTPIDLSAFDGD